MSINQSINTMSRMHSIKTTLFVSISAVLIATQILSGYMQYHSQAEQARGQVKAVAEAAVQPLVALAGKGIDGGNSMILTNKDAKLLYEATNVLYFKMSGMSAGAEKNDFSEAIASQKIEYEYSAPDQDVDKLRQVVMLGEGLNTAQHVYVQRIKLPDVKNGGELVAVFSAAELVGLEWRVVRNVGGVALIIVAIGVLLALWLGRLIADPVVDIARRMASITESLDFSALIPDKRKDELGQIAKAFNQLMEKFRAIIVDTTHSSKGIADVSNDLAASSSKVNESSATQADAASSVASSIEEVSKSVSETAGNARATGEIVEKAREGTDRALAAMAETVQNVNAIADLIRRSDANVGRLDESSKKIGGIIQVIKDVADQTNLLALNAAIEAARAGEQGRGFAVVADEVRKLAERTSRATTEIASLISDIQNHIGESVIGMQQANSQVTQSLELVGKTETALHLVGNDSREVAKKVMSISDAIREQDAAIHQVAANIERIAQMAESNSAAAASSSNTAIQLDSLSVTLKDSVARFKV